MNPDGMVRDQLARSLHRWPILRLPFLVFALLLLALPAARADGPEASALAVKASRALATHVATVARPDYSRPPASEYVRQIFDLQALAALGEPKSSDLPWLMDWSEASVSTLKLIMFNGATSAADGNQVLSRNMALHEDALAKSWAFTMRFQLRIAGSLLEFLGALPPEQRTDVRMRGLAKFRSGMIETVTGVIITLGSGMKPANTQVVMEALLDTAPGWIGMTTPDERAALLKIIRQANAARNPGVVADGFATIAKALQAEKD
jgi:hypothetical protein